MSTNEPKTQYSGPELCRLTATQAVGLLRKGEVKPSELLEASLTRIEQVEPQVNAVVTVCADRARDSIARLDEVAPSVREKAGWLAGLPIGIKDLSNVSGVRTTYGTKGFSDFVAETNDPLVDRLESNGAVIAGKTNTPEMGAGGNTFNQVFGMTRNPWDITRNAGGSSGGAAVSLATGEVWLSHGSDLAGSLRTPAAYCGVIGPAPFTGPRRWRITDGPHFKMPASKARWPAMFSIPRSSSMRWSVTIPASR